MTCEELTDLLSDFIANELATEIRATFEQHLLQCPQCGRQVMLFRMTIQITRALPRAEPLPSAFEQRLRSALARIQNEREA